MLNDTSYTAGSTSSMSNFSAALAEGSLVSPASGNHYSMQPVSQQPPPQQQQQPEFGVRSQSQQYQMQHTRQPLHPDMGETATSSYNSMPLTDPSQYNPAQQAGYDPLDTNAIILANAQKPSQSFTSTLPTSSSGTSAPLGEDGKPLRGVDWFLWQFSDWQRARSGVATTIPMTERHNTLSVLTTSGAYAAAKLLVGADYLGTKLAELFGIQQSRYQYVLDAYERYERQMAEEGEVSEMHLRQMNMELGLQFEQMDQRQQSLPRQQSQSAVQAPQSFSAPPPIYGRQSSAGPSQPVAVNQMAPHNPFNQPSAAPAQPTQAYAAPGGQPAIYNTTQPSPISQFDKTPNQYTATTQPQRVQFDPDALYAA